MIIEDINYYPDEYADEYAYNNPDYIYGYKIYNDMTKGNTFVMSYDKKLAKYFGEWLVSIYKNYDEETIDTKLDEFDNSTEIETAKVIVTNPEYWGDDKVDRNTYIVYEYDNSDLAYAVQIIGSWSSRF